MWHACTTRRDEREKKKGRLKFFICSLFLLLFAPSICSQQFVALSLRLTRLVRTGRAEAVRWDAMSKRKLAMATVNATSKPLRRVLIVGTGMTGSLTGYHLRQRMGNELRLEFADMARGAGGRMSTTRWGNPEVRANTGAQYISCCSPETEILLDTVCAQSRTQTPCPIERIAKPLKRSTHFLLKPDEAYSHWLPRYGTNRVVKAFLYAGNPQCVAFGSRLQQLTERGLDGKVCPQFDRGGGSLSSAFDCVVLAMPPKDILRFFNVHGGPDPQSQADLHRRTNKGHRMKVQLPPDNHHRFVLEKSVLNKLRVTPYHGRYSLAQWFEDGDPFVGAVCAGWAALKDRHGVIDMISSQPGGVLVVQSTVELWRQVEGGGRRRGRGKVNRGRAGNGGGRKAAQAKLVSALESLAGRRMPRPKHTKLLNWRTSQVSPPLSGNNSVVTAAGGRLVFTGDWCVESSFEGCNRAAIASAEAVMMWCRHHIPIKKKDAMKRPAEEKK